MLKVDTDGSVHLTRGDTARLKVNINVKRDKETTPYELADGDILQLSVKASARDSEPYLFYVTSTNGTFLIRPQDTAAAAFKKYIYDVELRTNAGEIYTIIEPSTFEICKEITTPDD